MKFIAYVPCTDLYIDGASPVAFCTYKTFLRLYKACDCR